MKSTEELHLITRISGESKKSVEWVDFTTIIIPSFTHNSLKILIVLLKLFFNTLLEILEMIKVMYYIHKHV